MGRAVYAGRRRVMRAADIKASAYLSDEVDAALASSSTAVDNLCNRGDADGEIPGFAPWTGTITFDWPVANNDDAYRFYLNQHTLISFTSATSAGDTITPDCLPWPEYGPPYSALDLDQGSSSILTFISGRGQRSLSIEGVWGCLKANYEKTSTAWQLTGAIDADDETAILDAPLDVGSIVRIGTERMIVTDQTWVDSTQTASIAASSGAQSLAVSDGTAFLRGEEILLDAETMLVQAIAGNTLVVKRAVAGSTLAAHTTAAVYQARLCTLERGALGTTAASHADGAQVYRFEPPPLVEQLTVAYSLDQLAQESSNYARTIGSGESERAASGQGIRALEKRVAETYGRQFRMRSI